MAATSFLLVAPAAWADGQVDVEMEGAGTGTVTSTSAHAFAAFGGMVTVAPGEIDCDETSGPTCSTFVDASDVFGNQGANVTLTADADPGSYFVGWAASGASTSSRCTTPPDENPTCLVGLNAVGATAGAPGVQATVTATFNPLPDPPAVTTGGVAPGAAAHLRTLEGQVNPNGFALASCRFEYGQTTDYGSTAACTQSPASLGSGNSGVPVSAPTQPLEPNATYHYRLVVSNVPGSTGHGEDRTFTTGPAAADDCPNADIRLAQGIATLLLPDCMALEMVSPPKKFNQFAADAAISEIGRIRFRAQGALADTPGLIYTLNDYVATRDAAGWVVDHTSPPTGTLNAVARLYSSGMGRWVGHQSTFPQSGAGVFQAFVSGVGGFREALSPLIEVANVDEALTTLHGASSDMSQLYFAAGSGTGFGVRVVALLPGDPLPAGAASIRNTYVAGLDADGQPSLELLARDGAGTVWGGNCGSALGSSAVPFDPNTGAPALRNQGAIALDGAYAYISIRPGQPTSGNCDPVNKVRIFKRARTPDGPVISPLVAGASGDCDRVANLPAVPACGTTGPSGTPVADGDDLFQGASVDGSRVYFTSPRQLADSDVDGSGACNATIGQSAGCDLYLYDSARSEGQRLVQVSAGDSTDATPGAGANVLNAITGISGDATRVYFVAQGVLTTDPNPAGDTAIAGQPNLYTWDIDSESTKFIGTLTAGDNLWGNIDSFSVDAYPVPVTGTDDNGIEVGGDGHVLVFQSAAALTADDGDSSRDVFRYDADTSSLERVSKGDTSCLPGCGNAAHATSASLAVSRGAGPDFADEGRWVSEDGDSIVFMSGENLFGDGTGASFSYLWRNGDLYRLPGTTFATASSTNSIGRPVLSRDGETVAFQSVEHLLPQDGDTALDVYVARAGGGFVQPEPEPAPCAVLADGCQGDGAGSVSVESETRHGPGGNLVAGKRKRLAVLALSSRARRRVARTGVLAIRVRASAPGRVSAVARRRVGKRTRRVAARSVRLVRPGTARLALRLSRVPRKRLEAGRSLRLAVEVRSPGARSRTIHLRLPGAAR